MDLRPNFSAGVEFWNNSERCGKILLKDIKFPSVLLIRYGNTTSITFVGDVFLYVKCLDASIAAEECGFFLSFYSNNKYFCKSHAACKSNSLMVTNSTCAVYKMFWNQFWLRCCCSHYNWCVCVHARTSLTVFCKLTVMWPIWLLNWRNVYFFNRSIFCNSVCVCEWEHNWCLFSSEYQNEPHSNKVCILLAEFSTTAWMTVFI